MPKSDFSIRFEFENINKIMCKNLKCKYNLATQTPEGWVSCNLKRITINDKGECQEKEEKVNAKSL